MPYLATAQQWLTQSTLLLQARPNTTRISTKYTIAHPIDPSNPPKPKIRKPKPSANTTMSSETSTQTPFLTLAPPRELVRATLTVKTYDPVSGATLKYETTKAAEVGRLIQSLGRLARPMAGLPELKEDVVMGEAVPGAIAEGGSGVATPVAEAVVPGTGKLGGGGPPGGQGGKKGKKKGKK